MHCGIALLTTMHKMRGRAWGRVGWCPPGHQHLPEKLAKDGAHKPSLSSGGSSGAGAGKARGLGVTFQPLQTAGLADARPGVWLP